MNTFDIFISFGITILGALLIFALVYFTIEDYKIDRFAAKWLEDKDNIILYNRFIKYLTTNLETGLFSPTRYPLSKVHTAAEYFELDGDDKVSARVVMVVFRDLSERKDGLRSLKSQIDEYLEQAEINKQLRGF